MWCPGRWRPRTPPSLSPPWSLSPARDRPWREGAATNEVGTGDWRWGRSRTNKSVAVGRKPGPSRGGWEGEFIGDDGRGGWIRLGRRRTGRGRVGGEVNGCPVVYTARLLLQFRSALLGARALLCAGTAGPDMTGFLASASKKRPPLADCDRFADGLLSPGESYPDRDEPRSHIYLSAAACRQSAVTTNSLLAVDLWFLS